ncbi:aminoacyl-tRNA hydrolase [Parasynechococcus marenigrum]|uniref:Peptidyl-tRNA hydrolase n=1 Tax=Parasynechococcus marenigrum (strain WH8102) TaxID=84588 RepID=PTH_PARMW|nr:aminoacyl-tRNA hydrolase [Parasynechococcus marenigrum]Q7U9I5.1 RecName: Full=Peptidyl-tRNA hydrolase; Short=PTH [Parasynechococcus marenigrum WH 8102]CAE06786.1 putative peptidyl-tRNA hydrolase (PTH) [Parasynechococcus marenigrum WH 8102]
MADVLRLVVGLGNPGTKYEGTRHNIGFMALEQMASREGFSFRQQSKLHGLVAEHGIGESRLRLLMPQTYMNDSGRSIRAALDWFGFTPEQLLVLVDDMDIPLGRLRLRGQGSAGGHNGLRSTIQHLGTQAFPRLRIGIGAPADNPAERRARTVSHVLGSFSRAEQPEVDVVLDGVLEAIQRIQRQGLDRAGNWINGFCPASVE